MSMDDAGEDEIDEFDDIEEDDATEIAEADEEPSFCCTGDGRFERTTRRVPFCDLRFIVYSCSVFYFLQRV